jgi:tRNA-uridine 2-sulfurtransferase
MLKVIVAMSGGVDSSVAAALLKDRGYQVIGVTMCLGIADARTKRPACCSAESIQDAKNVCRLLDIPHHVFSFEQEIQKFIVDNFIEEYARGRTPNPCVRCNRFLKFGKLLEQAMAIGVDAIATGHYAQIVSAPGTSSYSIVKSKDRQKDQTYFLYTLRRDDLPKILFPIGHLTKEKVRGLAGKFKLPVADKKESQDICFVPDGGYAEFLAQRLDGKGIVPGAFIDHNGKTVGEHQGIARYTIGQREKLGLALGYPAYVTAIDAPANTVYVGPKELLYRDALIAADVNWVSIPVPTGTIHLKARVRYQAKEVPARVEMERDRAKVMFEKPVMAITPGQSVVFYDGDTLLGGGIIENAFSAS